MSAEDRGQRLRVLLVDDDALARKVCGRLLGKLFDITDADSGKAALLVLKSGAHFDAVLSDYRMPSMTGVELLEQVRVLVPHARRVLMSAEDVFGLQEYLDCGVAQAFLGKPFDVPRAAQALGFIPPPEG